MSSPRTLSRTDSSRRISPAQAALVDPRFDAAALKVLEPRAAARRKNSTGGTGDAAVSLQLLQLAQRATRVSAQAQAVPRLDGLFMKLKENWK